MKFKLLIASGLMLANSMASAGIINSIGINFYDEQGLNGSSLPTNQSAGVVAQTYWNNETFTGRFDSNVAGNTGTVSTVNNNTGAVEAGLSYTYSGANNAWGNYGGNSATGDNALLNAHFEGDYSVGTGPTVEVSGVNYSTYDVYVYLADSSASVTIGDELFEYTTAWNSFATSGFVKATSSGGMANYALFTGLTGDSFQIDMAKIDGNRAAIAGFQVVEAASVPEPSTLAVLALGLMGLASRRFKK